MRALTHDGRLDGEPLDFRLRTKLARLHEHALRCVLRFGRRTQPEADTADIRLVRNVVGQDLHRDRRGLLEQSVRDLRDVLRRRRHPCRHGGNAEGGKHCLGFRLGQERAAGAHGRPHDRACRLVGDSRVAPITRRCAHERLLRLCVLPEIVEALDRVARRFVGGDIGRAELLARAGDRRLAEPAGEDRRHGFGVRRLHDGIQHRLCRFGRRGEGRGAVHHQDAVGLRVCEHGVERRLVAVRTGIADDVDRVGARPIGGKHLVQRGDELVAQGCQPAIEPHQIVNREHARAAAIGEDQELVARYRPQACERLRSGEQLLELLDADEPCAAEGGADRDVAAGERAGMRRGRTRGGRVPAGFDHDDRLRPRGRPCRRHEFAGSRDGLEIEQDRAGREVGGEEVEQVADIDIGHVSHGHHIGEADFARLRPVENAGHQRA